MEQCANQPEPSNYYGSPEASATANRDGLRSIVGWAVVMPALTAALGLAALAFGEALRWRPSATSAVYVTFVLSIAGVSYATGSRLRSRCLRGLVLGWAVLLIDILVVASTYRWYGGGYHRGYGLVNGLALANAFFSAQAGFLAAYVVLGVIAWYWRVAAFVLGLVFVALGCCLIPVDPRFTSFWVNYELAPAFWPTAVVCQAVAMAGLCGVLRFSGYSLVPCSARCAIGGRTPLGEHYLADVGAAGPCRAPLQFSIRHLFTGTTAIAVLVAILRTVPLEFSVAMLALAAVFAILSLTAVWGALGKERGLVRWPILCAMAFLCGLVVAIGHWLWIGGVRLLVRGFPAYFDPGWEEALSSFVDWTSWALLAAFFLAGMLGLFRAAGYRLVRRRRVAAPPV